MLICTLPVTVLPKSSARRSWILAAETIFLSTSPELGFDPLREICARRMRFKGFELAAPLLLVVIAVQLYR